MENEELLVKEIGNLVLNLFTIKELTEKGIKPTQFKWKFNSNNINLIPELELYNNNGVYKTFESTEFSKMLQDLLKETQLLFNCIDNIDNSKTKEELFSYLDVSTDECSECELRDLCPIRNETNKRQTRVCGDY